MKSGKLDDVWGWIIVLAAAGNRIIIYGVSYSAGIVYVVALEVFNEGSGITSWISSLIFAVVFFTCPLSGYLTNKIGERKVSISGGIIAAVGMTTSAFVNSLPMLILTYGIISGIGCGLAFMPGSVLVARYFKTRRNIALAVASAGGGIGSFAFPPFIEYLNKSYTWRGMFLILGGITLNITVFGALFRPLQFDKTSVVESRDNQDSKLDEKSRMISRNKCMQYNNASLSKNSIDENESEEISLSGCPDKKEKRASIDRKKGFMSKNPYLHMSSFYLLVINTFLYQFGVSIVNGHMQAFAVFDLRFLESEASILYTISGMNILVFKLLYGILPHICKRFCRPTNLLLFSYFIGGISTLCLLIETSYGIYFYSAVFGMSQAACGGPLLPTLVLDISGIESFGITYGLVLLGFALGQLAGSPIAGILFEKYKSYDEAFILAAVMMILSTLIMMYPCLTNMPRKEEKDVEIVLQSNELIRAKAFDPISVLDITQSNVSLKGFKDESYSTSEDIKHSLSLTVLPSSHEVVEGDKIITFRQRCHT